MTSDLESRISPLMNSESGRGYKQGAVSALVSIAVNIALTAFKFTAGILGNSSAMIADAVHSGSDVFSSAAVWIGMKIAAKPADKDHPWGHGKAEAVAAKAVAIILIIVGLDIGFKALVNISEKQTSAVKPIALLAAAVSIIVKEWNFWYVWRLGKKFESVSLKADAWHHRSDAISSVAALIGIAFTIYGGPRWHFMDHLAAAVVAGMIVFVGVKFFRRAASDLMDKLISEQQLQFLREAIIQTPGVKAVESLAARRSGLGILVDVHVEVDPEISVYEGHEIARRVRRDLIEKRPNVQNVLVHIEPCNALDSDNQASRD